MGDAPSTANATSVDGSTGRLPESERRLRPENPMNSDRIMLRAIRIPRTRTTFSEVVLFLLFVFLFAIVLLSLFHSLQMRELHDLGDGFAYARMRCQK